MYLQVQNWLYKKHNVFSDVIRANSGASGAGSSSLLKASIQNKSNLGSQNSIAYSSGEDDLEIIEVKPAPVSLLTKNKFGPGQGQTFAQAQALAAARQKLGLMGAGSVAGSMLAGSSSLLGNPFTTASGQGDFGLHAAAAGLLNGTTSVGQLDILQKCKIFKFLFLCLSFCRRGFMAFVFTLQLLC